MTDERVLLWLSALVALTVVVCAALIVVGWWPMAIAIAWIVYAYGHQPFYRFLRWRGRRW